MKDLVSKIREFHEAFGISETDRFGHVPRKRDILHYDLLIEEVEEFREACENEDVEKIIDGIGDVIFVAVSAAVERGYAPILEEVIMEICRANISKSGGSIESNVYREDGKVMRSDSYTPPDIAGIISNFINKQQ